MDRAQLGGIDDVVAVQNGLRRLDARLPQRLGKGLGLPGGKIQNGVIQIQKDILQHGGFPSNR